MLPTWPLQAVLCLCQGLCAEKKGSTRGQMIAADLKRQLVIRVRYRSPTFYLKSRYMSKDMCPSTKPTGCVVTMYHRILTYLTGDQETTFKPLGNKKWQQEQQFCLRPPSASTTKVVVGFKCQKVAAEEAGYRQGTKAFTHTTSQVIRSPVTFPVSSDDHLTLVSASAGQTTVHEAGRHTLAGRLPTQAGTGDPSYRQNPRFSRGQ
ncbi:hypothetical protein Anapl_03694 [Anas platyrhynchos]|uniref:Secreted protein n=1 Tax=Anas platyrhynchos TaxID=8839 RepID=R0K8E7_ANAPL|nr:hypothetical protein Anapl_03694 [Anas platyrhynchos]